MQKFVQCRSAPRNYRIQEDKKGNFMKAEIDGKTVRLPDFLLAGAGKSGTTSLYHYMKQHPQIFMPEIKEPKFFAFSEKPVHFTYPQGVKVIWKFKDYIELFESARDDQIIGEASPYLYGYEEIINNIKKYIPSWNKLKIIIILRNPVERVFSIYTMHKIANVEPLEFEEAIQPAVIQKRMKNNWARGFNYIGLRYYEPVKAYLDNFPYVKIYLFEDLKANVLTLVKDIFKFLGVDDSFSPDVSKKYMVSQEVRFSSIHNLLQNSSFLSSIFSLMRLVPIEKKEIIQEKILSKTLRFRMKEKTRQNLISYYREDILKLQKLIERDLSKWLR